MAYPLYLIVAHLLLPVLFIRLLVKSRHSPEYRRRWPERIGFYRISPPKPPIWIHTVSVGEFNAARPLITQLRQRYPTTPILVTTTTPTGSAAVRAFDSALYHVYLPYELPAAINRFINHWQPQVAIIFETEIWPLLFRKIAASAIPLTMANVRLSASSASGYRRIKPLISDTLTHPSAIATATKADAERICDLGADPTRVSVMGNIKFDYSPPADIQQQSEALRGQLNCSNRLIWVAASTHAGEEEQIIDAQKKLIKQIPGALLILVPRHPERFDEVAQLCKRHFIVARRSLEQPCTPQTDIYLADSMGELALFYSLADSVFVGGSLVPVGGHNLIEPAAVSKAPLFGPHMHNFVEISQRLLAADGATRINSSGELAHQVQQQLLDLPQTREQGTRALNEVKQHRGATSRLLAIVDEQLQETTEIR